MVSSTTVSILSNDQRSNNNSNMTSSSTTPTTVSTSTHPQLYRYQITKMTSDLSNVSIFENPLDTSNIFNEETLYHYCNLIIDQYESKSLNLALFRNDSNYGPKNTKIDVYFHPFEWKNQWHLALGFTNYDKILFVHCSNYSNSNSSSNVELSSPSFPTKTSLRIKEFILFFKQKLSKNSLKYPRLFTDLFEPVTNSNAINLLTVIFAFCLDPKSLTKSFCDPQYSPRKFDISDIHPIIQNLDSEFRQELKATNDKAEQKKKERKEKQEEKQRLEKLEKLENERMKKLRLERERKRKEEESRANEKLMKERLQLEKEEREKRMKERMARLEKTNIQNRIITKSTTPELEDKREDKILTANSNGKEELEINLKREFDSKATTVTNDKSDIKTDEIEPDSKRRRTRSGSGGGTMTTPIEINDLEDSDGIEDEYTDKNKNENKLVNGNESSNNGNKSITPEFEIKDKAEHENFMKSIFTKSISQTFKKHIYNLSLFTETNVRAIDVIYKLIRVYCYTQSLNPGLFQSNAVNGVPYDLRNSLIVTYRRRMKQEFDESKFEEMLEAQDSPNQIIPLIFENGSIFLINIKTTDNFHCIVRVICITNKYKRSEREIMKNYAFRRLVEMYVAKYKRLVVKIRTSIVYLKLPEYYKVVMTSFYILQRILWNNKFDLITKPKYERYDSYNVYFEKMMDSVELGDLFKTELNLRRTVKYCLELD